LNQGFGGGVMAQLIIVILGFVVTTTGLTGMLSIMRFKKDDLF
jgi:hypothetical protein